MVAAFAQRDGRDCRQVSLKLRRSLLALEIPDLHEMVAGSRDQQHAIWMEVHARVATGSVLVRRLGKQRACKVVGVVW
eukprot:scaffold16_cov242-Pinguiococcus_pyrenoidosus.AAC.7